MAMRQPSMQSEDEAPKSKIFPIELFSCCPSALKVLIPGTWMKIQDCTHLVLVVGTLACLIEMVRTLSKMITGKCLEWGCVKEILSLIFIAPCVFYILTIINQYDDRLQAKQRAAKMEKENLARSYNDLLSDMDGLLSKSAESSAGLAERTFESKRRDFQRFLERVKDRYPNVTAGTKEADALLLQFKRFCSNWLHVFEECSIDPVNYPKKVIKEEDLNSCTSVSEVAELCLDRLKKTEVRFISQQRDQDAQLLRKNKNEFRRMTQTERASRLLELPAPAAASAQGQNPNRKRRLSWLQFGGPRQFYIKSTPTKDAYPKEVRCFCGSMIILSFEHAKLLIGVVAGLCLMAYDIYVLATSKQKPNLASKIWEMTDLVAAEVCLIVMLSRFEELDIIQQLEREVKELARQNEQVEKQREKMNEFWSNAQQLTELWLYRTVPRLDLYKEVHNQLEDSKAQEDLLNHLRGANQHLEDLEQHLGQLQDWKQDGQITPEIKKQVGKAINEISKESELDKMLEKLEDAVNSKMKALKN